MILQLQIMVLKLGTLHVQLSLEITFENDSINTIKEVHRFLLR